MIIVTGASGFIGSNLVKALLERGERNILCIDPVDREYLKDLPIIMGYWEQFYSDLKGYCRNVKMVFHEGAISSTTETNKAKIVEKNIIPSLELIYYCRDNNIPLQYASSASVYGNPSVEEWKNPNKPLNPLNLYAISKKSIDITSELVISSKKPPCLLQGMRYFNVYGPNEDHKEDQASPYSKFSKQLKETGKIKLFKGSENFYRDFISVEKLIEIKLKAIETKPSGIYDIGTGNPKSFYDVAKEILDNEGVSDIDSYIEWISMPDNLKEHYQKYSLANMKWLD